VSDDVRSHFLSFLLFFSQCQQYGFQRIVPSLDFMTAKAYYTTRLVADARYSHLISNGDLAPGYFDPQSGKPTPKALQDGRVEVMYYNHKVILPLQAVGQIGGIPATEAGGGVAAVNGSQVRRADDVKVS